MPSYPADPDMPTSFLDIMRGATGAVALLVLATCTSSPEPAMSVAEVAFSDDDVLGLSSARLEALAAITAVGLAVSAEEVEHLGAPLLERQRRERLIEKLADEIALERAGVSDEVLEERYLTDPEQELTVRHLVVRAERWEPESRRAEAREKAEAALRRARDGEPFPEVAAEVSEEPGARRTQGLLSPGTRGTWVDEFWDAARRLPVGELSSVVETEYGFHVLRLEDRSVVPFPEHRDEVVREVAGLLASREEREASLDSIAEALTVDEGGVRAWREGEAPDSAVLAHWPEGDGGTGTFTVAELERYRASIPGSRGERIRSRPVDEVEMFVLEAAREALFAARSQERGFEVTEWDEARILREWNDRVTRWATALRFGAGQDPLTLKERALAGLDSDRQEMEIVREDIQRLSPLLRAAYPIVIRERDSADAGRT